MTQFHDWEWFTGEVPTGRVQIQCAVQSRIDADSQEAESAGFCDWSIDGVGGDIIAFRRVKEPVRGDVVMTGCKAIYTDMPSKYDTHRLTLPTEDGALIAGEYIGPGGAVVKVEVIT